MDQLFPQVGLDAARVLRHLGCAVEFRREQTCCGQPAFNSGYWNEAKPLARRFLDVFADAEAIVCPSGSCATMARVFYPELFAPRAHGVAGPAADAGAADRARAQALAPRIFEFSDFLVRHLGAADLGAQFPHRVAFHDACHALRELGVKQQPRTLLRAVRGLDLVELPDAEECCGFGGTFAVKMGAISAGIGARKCDEIEAAGVDWIVSCDASCLMQIEGLLRRRGSRARALHIASLLARGLERAADGAADAAAPPAAEVSA